MYQNFILFFMIEYYFVVYIYITFYLSCHFWWTFEVFTPFGHYWIMLLCTLCVSVWFLVFNSFVYILAVELLSLMVIWCSTFWETVFTMTGLYYIPISSVQRVQFLHIFFSTHYFLLKNSTISGVSELLFSYGSDLHSPND